MKSREIPPSVAGAVIAIVVLVVVLFIYKGTSQKMSDFDHAKMRAFAAKAGMSVPKRSAKPAGAPTNDTH